MSPKQLSVMGNELITPNMIRLTLGGEGSQHFSQESVGQYVKFLFTADGSTDISALPEGQRPMMRTFTVSGYQAGTRDEAGTITIDVAKHELAGVDGDMTPEIGGYASRWALKAQAGDTISLVGPRPIQAMPVDAERFLLVADMTAQTALQGKLALLPETAEGFVVLDVTAEADVQALNLPTGMTLVVNISGGGLLSDSVKALDLDCSDLAVWCACEFSEMRAVRSYITSEKGVDRKMCYFSSYWKKGVTEDGHKVLKREDSMALEAQTLKEK
ncbi:siderophore-interacting protein [Photobacterium sp. ZSDE20]|uniref:Siderophore-interacting protein n=1 Tax=Photobacterium pectinilyticum TaxID=2906793 RepID=A0ABT1NA46_9GAMM|nr:siderophore-interacting protein [Photobacterium sp. ZSDE20]MCQ1060581.1 siderophore-interacting protein [Photobacterium sp. ZSDE20]MDD1828099.1 siderophore-interacting protein [Photobacterium sp. ZSDE20]